MDIHRTFFWAAFLIQLRTALLFDFRRFAEDLSHGATQNISQFPPLNGTGISQPPFLKNGSRLQLEENSSPDAQRLPRQFGFPWYGGGGGMGGGGLGFGGRFPNYGGSGGGGGGTNSNPRCPGGYFCVSVDDRRICGEGFFCPPGSNAQTPCPTGTYARRGATSCLRCPAGYQCPQETVGGTTQGARYPTQCGEGFYCPPGTGNAIRCPSGYYCTNENAPDFKPIPCPAGSYAANVENTQPSDCLTCPAGTYSNPGASACIASPMPNNNNNNFGGFGGFGGYHPFGGYGGYGGRGWNGFWGK